jgi:hypothetical protein
MSKYQFQPHERLGIWKSDNQKCLYCGLPLHLDDVQIDHIVRESVQPSFLAEVRQHLSEFGLNEPGNWATCHQGCNRRKGMIDFDLSSTLFYLNIARHRADEATRLIREFERRQANDKLLEQVALALDSGQLAAMELVRVIENLCPQPNREDPWILAFGVNYYDPLPAEAPDGDPELADWLKEAFVKAVSASGASFEFVDDERSGETMSLRSAFWSFDIGKIMAALDPCWDLLAAQKYSEVFPDAVDDAASRLNAIREAALGTPAKIVSFQFTDGRLWFWLLDGRELTVPLSWFPRLAQATPADLQQWELIGGGIGIHWPLLDEDVSVENLLAPRLVRREYK